MRIIVDRTRCTGQAMCESVAPDIFRVADDGQVEIRVAVVPDEQAERGGVGGILLPQRGPGP